VRDVAGAERTVRACVPRDEIGGGIGYRFDESTGEAARYGGAKGIAEPRCILGRGHPGLPGDPYRDRPVFGFQRSQQCVGVNRVDVGSRAHFFDAQVADVAQQVVKVVEAAYAPSVGCEPLQLEFEALARRRR
jgi:hypothetical protein